MKRLLIILLLSVGTYIYLPTFSNTTLAQTGTTATPGVAVTDAEGADLDTAYKALLDAQNFYYTKQLEFKNTGIRILAKHKEDPDTRTVQIQSDGKWKIVDIQKQPPAPVK